MSDNAGVTTKVVENVTGALEKLANVRMLILGLTLLVYADIWLIKCNFNPTTETFESSLASLKVMPISLIVSFWVTYSLLVAAAIPAVRIFYSAFWAEVSPKSHFNFDRTSNEKQVSDWSLALVLFSLWNISAGYFSSNENYKGVIFYVCNYLDGDGPTVMIFRASIGIFALCLMGLGFQRDA